MKELNWPKHLSAKSMASSQRGLAVAGIGVLALGIVLVAWFNDEPATAAPQAAAPAPPAAAAPVQPVVTLPEAEPPPPPTSADVARSSPPAEAAKPEAPKDNKPVDWATLPFDELRVRAETNDIPAMEEMARRVVQGIGVVKDQQAGAGWLLRAAQLGSPQSAFNVGVMYERGFVVERDSTKAAEWYRKAADANVPMAKHNLALLLRDGKGSARNVPEAIGLLRSAARQGMAASMFTLGDIYERGDGGAAKDPAMALAWFAITAEFERQVSKGVETPLIKTAMQRAQALQRSLTPAELERAQKLGQVEFKQIVDALSITAIPQVKPADSNPQAAAAPADPPGWPPANTGDQVRAVQQALFDLKLLRDKPDGAMGPVTRAAIRDFERGAGLRQTGELSKEVYAALKDALMRRDTVANSPLPAPPPQTAPAEPAKPEAKAEAPKPAPARVDPPKPEPPKIAETKPEPQVNIGTPPPAPPPPTSADIAKAAPRPELAKAEPAKTDPDAWPATAIDQVKAIQVLLRELNFSRDTPDGQVGPATRIAIRDYQRAAGLKESGEPSKALFESLKEMRGLVKR